MADGLKIIHFNTQGFQNKISHINNFVRVHKPDILVLTEHFQKNASDLENIEGYKIVNSFCRKHNERGGVAIWARPNIPCRPRKDLDRHRKEKEFELVSVSVGEDVVVTGAYRPPSTSIQDFYKHLEGFTKKINKEPHIKHVIAGDFNIDNSKPNKTRNVLTQNDLMFHITSMTHRHGRSIDNFITNFKTPRSRVIKSKSSNFSDHHPIEIIICNKASMIRKKADNFLYKLLTQVFGERTSEQQVSSANNTKSNESLSFIYNIFSFILNKDSDSTDVKTKQYSKKRKISPAVESFSFFDSIISFVTPNWLKSKNIPVNTNDYKKQKNINHDSKKDQIQEHSFFSRIKHFFSSTFCNNCSSENLNKDLLKTSKKSQNRKNKENTTTPQISFFSKIISAFV